MRRAHGGTAVSSATPLRASPRLAASAVRAASASAVRAASAAASPPSLSPLLTFSLLYLSYCVSCLCKRLPYSTLVSAGIVSASSVGGFGSAFELCGGLAKLCAGVLVDLAPAGAVLSGSLAAASAACLLFFSAPGGLRGQLALWGAHGAAQALAWPAAARLFLGAFPQPAGRGAWYSLLSTSQNAGAALAPLVVALAVGAGGPRAALVVPGAAAGLLALVVAARLGRCGRAVGGAAVGGGGAGGVGLTAPPPPPPPSLSALAALVLPRRRLWLLGGSCFFNALARVALGDWAALALASAGAPPSAAAGALAALEAGGAAGGLAAGALSDALCAGRRGPVAALAGAGAVPLLAAAAAALEGGWRGAHAPSPAAVRALFACLGAALHAPHVLNGLAAGEAVPPAAAASAAALAKALGQAGGALAGLPLGALAGSAGWPAALRALAAAAALSAALAAATWGDTAWEEEAPRAEAPRAEARQAEARGQRGSALGPAEGGARTESSPRVRKRR